MRWYSKIGLIASSEHFVLTAKFELDSKLSLDDFKGGCASKGNLPFINNRHTIIIHEFSGTKIIIYEFSGTKIRGEFNAYAVFPFMFKSEKRIKQKIIASLLKEHPELQLVPSSVKVWNINVGFTIS